MKLDPTQKWIDSQGRPTEYFRNFMVQQIAALKFGPLVSAASDGAAATAGVPVGGLYQNSGVVHVRLS